MPVSSDDDRVDDCVRKSDEIVSAVKAGRAIDRQLIEQSRQTIDDSRRVLEQHAQRLRLLGR